MKIVEDSPNRLVLKEGDLGPIAFAIITLLVGIVVLVLGLTYHAKLHNSYLFDAIGIVVVGLGVFLLASAKSDTVTADKTSQLLTVIFKSLKNKQGANQSYSFADIQSVQLTQHYQQVMEAPNNINNGPGISFGGGFGVGNINTQTMLDQNLAILLKNGTTITIANEDKQTGFSLGISANSLVTKGQKLAAVIGVPFNQQGPSSPGQLFQGIERDIVGQPQSFNQSPPPQTPSNQPDQSPPDRNDGSWQNQPQ